MQAIPITQQQLADHQRYLRLFKYNSPLDYTLVKSGDSWLLTFTSRPKEQQYWNHWRKYVT